MDVGAALRRAARELATVAAIADPGRRVPATPEWTIADLVAHVTIECDRYRRELEGDGEWSASGADIPETNRRALAAREERDIGVALASIGADVDRYVELLAARDLDVASHHLDGGILLAPRHAAGILLGELAIHRRDVALAMGGKAEIAADDALAIVTGAVHVIPAMVDRDAARGRNVTIELRLRGAATYTIRLADGEAQITEGRADRRDAVISADPLGFLLLSYGRRGQLATILRGAVLAWGRRPDRALLLDRVVHRP